MAFLPRTSETVRTGTNASEALCGISLFLLSPPTLPSPLVTWSEEQEAVKGQKLKQMGFALSLLGIGSLKLRTAVFYISSRVSSTL